MSTPIKRILVPSSLTLLSFVLHFLIQFGLILILRNVLCKCCLCILLKKYHFMFAVHIFRSVQCHIVILSQMQLQMKFRMLIPYLFFQVLIFKRHFIISQMYKNFFLLSRFRPCLIFLYCSYMLGK